MISAAGVVIFYLALLPVSNLVLKVGIILSERALYIPSAGLVLSFAALFQGFWTKMARTGAKIVAAAAVAALVVAGVVATRRGNQDWVSNDRLFAAAVKHPYCGYVALAGMGNSLWTQGRYEEALLIIERSIAMRPNLNNLQYQVLCLMALNRYADAIAPLRTLVNTDPRNTGFIAKLATCYLRVNRPADALQLLTQIPDLTAQDASLRALLEEANGRRPETR